MDRRRLRGQGKTWRGGEGAALFLGRACAQHVVEGNEEVVAAGRGRVRRGGSESQKGE